MSQYLPNWPGNPCMYILQCRYFSQEQIHHQENPGLCLLYRSQWRSHLVAHRRTDIWIREINPRPNCNKQGRTLKGWVFISYLLVPLLTSTLKYKRQRVRFVLLHWSDIRVELPKWVWSISKVCYYLKRSMLSAFLLRPVDNLFVVASKNQSNKTVSPCLLLFFPIF